MIFVRLGRHLWDFRINACRLYFGSRHPVGPTAPLPSRAWPFFRVEVE